MTTMSNIHSRCSATYQTNLHSMRTLEDRQEQSMFEQTTEMLEKKRRKICDLYPFCVDLSSSSTVDDDSWKHIEIYKYIYIYLWREREREYASDIARTLVSNRYIYMAASLR